MTYFHQPRIVITGGAGFIGSCLIRYLNDFNKTEILVADRLNSSEKWKNLIGKKIAHLIDKEDLFDWLKENGKSVEAIVHLGACTDTMELDGAYLLKNNYEYSVRLAEYALQNNKRFIYASSAATYGDGSQGFVDNEEEIFTLIPLNMYGFSKQLFDQWVKNQNAFNQVVGLKFFNVFGPNEMHKGKMASAVVKMVSHLKRGEKVRLFKSDNPSFLDGEQKRDFIYVKDVVRMIAAFLENKVCGLFNIGSGQASSWNELAEAVHLAMNKKSTIEYIDMPAELLGKYQNYSRAKMQKVQSHLKEIAHCRTLEESVLDYVRNYLLLERMW